MIGRNFAKLVFWLLRLLLIYHSFVLSEKFLADV